MKYIVYLSFILLYISDSHDLFLKIVIAINGFAICYILRTHENGQNENPHIEGRSENPHIEGWRENPYIELNPSGSLTNIYGQQGLIGHEWTVQVSGGHWATACYDELTGKFTVRHFRTSANAASVDRHQRVKNEMDYNRRVVDNCFVTFEQLIASEGDITPRFIKPKPPKPELISGPRRSPRFQDSQSVTIYALQRKLAEMQTQLSAMETTLRIRSGAGRLSKKKSLDRLTGAL